MGDSDEACVELVRAVVVTVLRRSRHEDYLTGGPLMARTLGASESNEAMPPATIAPATIAPQHHKHHTTTSTSVDADVQIHADNVAHILTGRRHLVLTN